MSIKSIPGLAREIVRYQLLDPDQIRELEALRQQFREPYALLRELIRLGRITAYQANLIIQGRASELALGSHVILERLGEGGMGTVYKARHKKLGRIDAVKVIRKQRLDRPEAVRRFRREIHLSSNLNHPNMVRAFDADEVDGTCVFVMEFVDGIDLARLVKRLGPLPVRSACEFIRQAALGLHHAHDRGLVHRDIKPANLLVTFEGCQVKVLDLGLARVFPGEGDGESISTMTQEGAVLGTPDYIAPEQARRARTADARADLYSLGCTLYFLLTARPPYEGLTMAEKLLHHQTEPATPLRHIRPEVPETVAAVVERLMAKKPEDRYQSADQLEAVLTAVLGKGRSASTVAGSAGVSSGTQPGDSVMEAALAKIADELRGPQQNDPFADVGLALTIGLGETAPGSKPSPPPPSARIWVITTGCLAVLLAVVTLGLLGVVTGAIPVGGVNSASIPAPPAGRPISFRLDLKSRWQDTGIDVEPDEPVNLAMTTGWRKGPVVVGIDGLADGPQDRAVTPNAQYLGLLARVGDDPEPVAVGRFEKLRPRARGRLFLQVNDLDLAENNGTVELTIEGGTPAPSDPTGPAVPPPPPVRRQAAEDGWLALRPVFEKAAAGAAGPAARADVVTFCRAFMDTARGRAALAFLPRFPSPLDALTTARIDPAELEDVRRTAGGAVADRLVGVFGTSRLHHWQSVGALAVDPTGPVIASGSDDGIVKLWDSKTGREIRRLTGHRGQVRALAYSPAGTLLVSAGEDRLVRFWDPHRGDLIREIAGHDQGIFAVAVSPDGTSVASAGADAVIRVWDAGSGRRVGTLVGHANTVRALAFGAAGTLASGGADETVKFWNVAAGTLDRSVSKHQGEVLSLAYNPARTLVLAGNRTGTATLWEAASGTERLTIQAHSGPVNGTLFGSDGRAFATAGQDGFIRVWKTDGGQVSSMFTGTAYLNTIAIQAEYIVAGTYDNRVRLWDVQTAAESATSRPGLSVVQACALDADGTIAAGSWYDPQVRFWRPPTPGKVASWDLDGFAREPAAAVTANLDWAPSGRLAVGGWPNADVWDTRPPVLRCRIPQPVSGDVAVTWDGRYLATTGEGEFVQIRDAETGRERFRLGGHRSGPRSVAFLPDGNSLVSGGKGEDGTTRLWDLGTGKELRAVACGDEVTAVAVHPEGRLIASVKDRRAVLLWDPATGDVIRTLETPNLLTSLAFSPDGRFVAASGTGGLVRVWETATGKEQLALRLGPGIVYKVRFAADGRHLATANANGTLYLLRLTTPPGPADKSRK